MALPWGLSPRSCVGRTAAESALTLLLAHTAHEHHLTVEERVGVRMRMVTVPDGVLRVRLQRREDD